jgi:3-mercaptopyruvate sulfurtransferase SseA
MARNDGDYLGALEVDSPWRTDTTARSGVVKFRIVDPIDDEDVESSAVAANLVNEEDKAVCASVAAIDDRMTDDSVLISTTDLKAWVDAGVPTAPADPHGYGKFVILHVDNITGYGNGHLPGAFLLNTGVDLSATRSDGIAPTISQVPTKEQMDNLIQRTGIDEDTIVVFTTSSVLTNMMSLGRAYFNFRYWGFPKERLRVLDGHAGHYAADTGVALVAAAPDPVVSIYTVCNLRQDESVDRFRASFEEMFDVAEAGVPETVIADARSADEFNGVPGKTTSARGNPYFVAFEGRIKGAEHQEWTELLDGGKLLPKEDLETAMAEIGASDATTVYTYCRTSWRAGVNFLALDAVLGWPVKIYDGAWIQWGQMASNEAKFDGSLAPDSPWRTDHEHLSEGITYNKVSVALLGANSYAPGADLINQQDAAVGGGSTGGAGGSGGSGGSAPSAPGYN